MASYRDPTASSQKSHESRDGENRPGEHEDARHSGRCLEHGKGEVRYVVRPDTARQRLIEVFGELGEAGAGDHEGSPGGEHY
jgi:hypothetical protein